MRSTTDRLGHMLEGSRSVTWEASIVRGDEAIDNVPVELGGSLSWNASQQVEFSGSVRVALAHPGGRSRAPRAPADLFAPFGTEVLLTAVVALGDMIERVQVARARVTKVPSVRPHRQHVNGEWVTLAEVLTLDVRDRMEVLKADEFDADTPISSASAWTELEHLSPFPIVRDGPDATLPLGLLHEGSKADAVQTVANRLGGVAAFDSMGNLIVRRESTTPALTLTLGPSGTVTEVGSVMDADGVYNRVVVKGKRPDGSIIIAEAVASGPLSPTVWGRRTYTADRGDFITTQAQAQADAERVLAVVSSIRTTELEVQALLDPRVELGDVVTVEWQGQAVPIRVAKISYGSPLMTVSGRQL